MCWVPLDGSVQVITTLVVVMPVVVSVLGVMEPLPLGKPLAAAVVTRVRHAETVLGLLVPCSHMSLMISSANTAARDRSWDSMDKDVVLACMPTIPKIPREKISSATNTLSKVLPFCAARMLCLGSIRCLIFCILNTHQDWCCSVSYWGRTSEFVRPQSMSPVGCALHCSASRCRFGYWGCMTPLLTIVRWRWQR